MAVPNAEPAACGYLRIAIFTAFSKRNPLLSRTAAGLALNLPESSGARLAWRVEGTCVDVLQAARPERLRARFRHGLFPNDPQPVHPDPCLIAGLIISICISSRTRPARH